MQHQDNELDTVAKEMKRYVNAVSRANMDAIVAETEGLAVMTASGFGRVESRLDSIELRLECIESLIKNPNQIPIQHYILHPEKRLTNL